MIRFGIVIAAVLAAIGLLVAGVSAGSLTLVATSVGVAALAGVLLLAVVIIWRREIFATPERAASAGQVLPEPARRQLREPPVPQETGPRASPVRRAPGQPEVSKAGSPKKPGAAKRGAKPGAVKPAVAKRDAAKTEPPTEATRGIAERRAEPAAAKPEVVRRESAAPAPEPPATARAEQAKPAPQAAAAPTRDERPGTSEASEMLEYRPSRYALRAQERAATRAAGPTPAAEAASRVREESPPKTPASGEPKERAPSGAEPPGKGSDDAKPKDAAAEPAAASTVRVVPGIARYHRSDCLLIRFLTADDLEVMTAEEAAASGCAPCKACKPEGVAAQSGKG